MSPRTRARASSGGLLAVGWLALAVVGRAALAAAPDGQEALGRLAAGSPAALALQHQPVVPDPAAAWHWAPVLATVRAQARQTAAVDAAALRRGLVDLAVLDAAGEPLPPGGTVASVIALGRTLRPVAADSALRARWARALQQQLVPVWPDGPVPLPAELELVADRTAEQVPGLWTSTLANGAPRAATWALRLRHAGARPLAPGELRLHLSRGPRAEPIAFDCARPRGERRRALLPGQELDLVCHSQRPLSAARADWGEALDRLQRRDAGGLLIDSHDLRDAAAAERMMDVLAEATPSPVPGFAARFADCASRGACAEVPAARAAPPPAGWSSRALALATLQLLLAFGAYMAVARGIGAGRASALLMLVLGLASVVVGLRQPSFSLLGSASIAGGWIAIPVLLGGSVLVVGLCHLTWLAYAWLFFRERG